MRRGSVRISAAEAAFLRRLLYRGLGSLTIANLALAVIQRDQARLAKAAKKRA